MLEKYGTVVSLGEDRPRPLPSLLPASLPSLWAPAVFLFPEGLPCHPPWSPPHPFFVPALHLPSVRSST